MEENETITLLEKHLLDEMENVRWLKGQILTLKKRERASSTARTGDGLS